MINKKKPELRKRGTKKYTFLDRQKEILTAVSGAFKTTNIPKNIQHELIELNLNHPHEIPIPKTSNSGTIQKVAKPPSLPTHEHLKSLTYWRLPLSERKKANITRSSSDANPTLQLQRLILDNTYDKFIKRKSSKLGKTFFKSGAVNDLPSVSNILLLSTRLLADSFEEFPVLDFVTPAFLVHANYLFLKDSLSPDVQKHITKNPRRVKKMLDELNDFVNEEIGVLRNELLKEYNQLSLIKKQLAEKGIVMTDSELDECRQFLNAAPLLNLLEAEKHIHLITEIAEHFMLIVMEEKQ
ncbi:MAG: hypothetical protein V1672_05750 [Candidatus Diapherotrites archaeon]